eukprot:605184-Rhodomonas_salina.2
MESHWQRTTTTNPSSGTTSPRCGTRLRRTAAVVNYKTRITKFVACKSDPDNGEAISAQSSTSSTSVDSTGYPLCYTPTAAGSSPASSSAKSSGSAAQSRLSGPPITLNHKGSLNTPIVLVSKPFGITSRESSKICQQPSSH